MPELTPRQIVEQLDRYVIGQAEAKRAVALALRNRWRSRQLESELGNEVSARNILLIGPTGVGKTDIARRSAALANAPFVKVEATRFIHESFGGRDVERIIRDLADRAVEMFRAQAHLRLQTQAAELAEDRILEALAPRRRGPGFAIELEGAGESEGRKDLRRQVHFGELDDREIEFDINNADGFESNGGSNHKGQKRTAKIVDARQQMIEQELAKLIDESEIHRLALAACEQNGIVFINNIDKLARESAADGAAVTLESAQRDLLPLIEGCVVGSKYGPIRTERMLFIAAGVFDVAKPEGLIAELRSRFPVRIELPKLTRDEYRHILVEPENALLKQHTALLAAEGVTLDISADAADRLAEIACTLNDRRENIGARRLHMLLDTLLEQLSFEAPERSGTTVVVDRALVDARLGDIVRD
jgi:ATP-dependent HslUV protease ATP-binding subunit HslU